MHKYIVILPPNQIMTVFKHWGCVDSKTSFCFQISLNAYNYNDFASFSEPRGVNVLSLALQKGELSKARALQSGGQCQEANEGYTDKVQIEAHRVGVTAGPLAQLPPRPCWGKRSASGALQRPWSRRQVLRLREGPQLRPVIVKQEVIPRGWCVRRRSACLRQQRG